MDYGACTVFIKLQIAENTVSLILISLNGQQFKHFLSWKETLKEKEQNL